MKTILLLSALLASSAWAAEKKIPAGQDEEATLGMGYNSDTQHFAGRCLKGTIQSHGQAKANVSMQQSLDKSDVSSELGFEAGGRFRYGAAKVGISAKYLRNQSESRYSIVAVYAADYKFKNQILVFTDSGGSGKPEELERARLSDVGIAVRKDDTRWGQTCGDNYVEQIERGAKLFYSIRIDFSSAEEKDQFEAGFSYSSSFASTSANLKKSSSNFSKSTKVTVGALQIGGDVRRVTEIFGGEKQQGAAMGFVKCSFGDLEKCDQVLANALEYATKEFKNQLETEPKEPNPDSGPAYLNYIVKPYSAAGVYAKFSSVMNKDIIAKRVQIEAAFDREMLTFGQIDHLLNSKTVVLSPRQNQAMKKLFDVSTNNRRILVAAAEACYQEPVNCAPAADGAFVGPGAIKNIDDEELVINPETFRQYCELKDSVLTNAEWRSSLQGMIAAARKAEPDSFKSADANIPVDECLASHLVFSRSSKMDFSGQNIYVLEPLREYKNFTDVNFSNNKIDDVTALADWTGLRELNLQDNGIRDVAPLAALGKLQRLNVSGNNLRSIDALAQMPSLERIDARNNFPEVNCKAFGERTCLSVSVRTDANFIPIRTLAPLKMFMPQIAAIDDRTAFTVGLGSIGATFNALSNEFRASNPLGDSSYGQAMVAMDNGRILISGGWNSSKRLLEYDPVTGIISVLEGLKTSRAEHLMTKLQDGRVLITGGWEGGQTWTGSDASYTAEIYDPALKTSRLLKNMGAPRAWHTATLLDSGEVLITGGYSNSMSLASAEIFDPRTEKFAPVAKTMREGRGGHTATKLKNGNVLITGGFSNFDEIPPAKSQTPEVPAEGVNPADEAEPNYPAIQTAEIFKADTKTFVSLSEPMTEVRGHHSAILLKNGKVLLTGGSKLVFAPDAPLPAADKSFSKTAELFDPEENSFLSIPAKMAQPRVRHAMHELRPGLVLVLGGLHEGATTMSETFTYIETQVNLSPILR